MLKNLNHENMCKDDYLKLISLKIVKAEENTFYLTKTDESFKCKILSESATHIEKGIDNLIKRGLISFSSYEDNLLLKKVKNNLNRKKCGYCGKGFKPKNNAEKYCSKNCRKFAKREQNEKSKQKQRKNRDYIEKQLGNSNLGPHANKNEEKEINYVHNEFKRIFNSKDVNP